ncbi:MAG: DUF1800 family protein, partial [Betaproteobacteria bacterium]
MKQSIGMMTIAGAVAVSLALGVSASTANVEESKPAPNPEKLALHVLNRIGYGPKPGDLDAVMKMGVTRYIQSQLHPESIPLPASLTSRLAALGTEESRAGDVLSQFIAARKDAKEEKKDKDRPMGTDPAQARAREIIGRIAENTAESRLARAIDSPR